MKHEKMKIYCQSCREYCLDATDEFIPGGPYNGAMFAAPEAARYNIDPLIFQEWMVHGDLFCPRCEQQFILPSVDGKGEVILTEYGLLEPGMTTIDKSCHIINEDFGLQSMTIWNPGDGSTETPGEMNQSLKTAPPTEEPTSASGIITMGGGPVLNAIAKANKTGVPCEIVEQLTASPTIDVTEPLPDDAPSTDNPENYEINTETEGLPPGVTTPTGDEEDEEFGLTTGLPPGVIPETEEPTEQPEAEESPAEEFDGLPPTVTKGTFACEFCHRDDFKSAGGRGSHERTCPGKAA